MRLKSPRRVLRQLWSAFAAFLTALCLMAAGTAQAASPAGGLAHSSVTPGKVSSEV
jgi:hypothetical protein